MFDPTAFDNMKTIIEGYIYEKDLAGELIIDDRNDVVNLAKLSREFSIRFKLKDCTKDQSAKLILKAGLENLSAELLPENITPRKQGCFVKLQFRLNHPNESLVFDKLQHGFKEIWGDNRVIQQCVHYNPFNVNQSIHNHITIDFNRIILEDQIDDLLIMVDHMIETLSWLCSQIN